MSVETFIANHQALSRTRELAASPEPDPPPTDTTPDALLLLSWNQLSGPFTDSILGNNGVVSGSPERGVNESGSGITAGSSRDVAFSGSGVDFVTVSHLPQYEAPRWGLVTYLQPDTLAATSDKQIPIAKYTSAESGRLTVEIYNDGGTGRVRVGLGAGGFIQSNTGVGTVVAGTATRIGITYDGTTARIYQDTSGVIASEAIANAGMDNNTADWVFGQFPGGAAAYDGIMGDTVFYDYDFDQTFFENLDTATSITHDTGGSAPGSGEFTLPEQDGITVNTDFSNLVHDGHDSRILPGTSTDIAYNLTGSIRTVDLTNPPSNLTWDGQRGQLTLDSIRFTGGGFYGGATICTNMDADYNWNALYQASNHQRPSILMRDLTTGSGNFTFEGYRAHGVGWDVFAFGQGTRDTLSNVTLLRNAITLQRDDAVENDNWVDGISISNCFIESFVLISCRNSGFNGSSRVNTIQNTLHYLLPCRYDGDADQLAPIFKLNANSVRFRVIDSIFAIPAGTPFSSVRGIFGDLIDYGKLHPDSEGNTICWLGEGSFPYDNPDASRFTVLTGSTAQNTWEDALAAWWDAYPGHRFNLPGILVDPAAP